MHIEMSDNQYELKLCEKLIVSLSGSAAGDNYNLHMGSCLVLEDGVRQFEWKVVQLIMPKQGFLCPAFIS